MTPPHAPQQYKGNIDATPLHGAPELPRKQVSGACTRDVHDLPPPTPLDNIRHNGEILIFEAARQLIDLKNGWRKPLRRANYALYCRGAWGGAGGVTHASWSTSRRQDDQIKHVFKLTSKLTSN